MKILDLFAGIGGFSLAGHWAGFETVAFVEWEKYPQKVLAKNFPNVPIYGDIREFDGTKYRGSVDIITGGFPCQPFSTAGKRKGTNDDRYLWPEMLRVIREVQPTWVIGENVAGLVSMDDGAVLEEVCTSLEGEGYKVQPFIIPACGKGAPHRRDRIWIVAKSNRTDAGRTPGGLQKANQRKGVRSKQRVDQFSGSNQTHSSSANSHNSEAKRQQRNGRKVLPKPKSEGLSLGFKQYPSNPDKTRLQGQPCGGFGGVQSQVKTPQGGEFSGTLTTGEQWQRHWLEAATRLCLLDDGLPPKLDASDRATIYNAVGYFGREEVERKTGLDLSKVEERIQRTDRLKALGNSIVPQIAYEFFEAIKQYERP